MAGIGISLSRLRKLRDLFEKRLKAASGKSAWRPAAAIDPAAGDCELRE